MTEQQTTPAAGNDDRPPAKPAGSAWPSMARRTIMTGLCIDWYRDVDTYERQRRWTVSASREGVLISDGTYLHTIPGLVLEAAKAVHEHLAAGRRDAAERYATHKPDGPSYRPHKLIPIEGTDR